MASSPLSILLSVFYLVLFLFAASDLKQFSFHVQISRVDRAPVDIDVDSGASSPLWYPISMGIVLNIVILIFTTINLSILLSRRNLAGRLCLSTVILLFLFTLRMIINLVITKNRNGLATPTLVERSFFASSISLEEELTTIVLDWLLKFVGLCGTFLFCYQQKQETTMSVERREEIKLMSSFD